MTKKFAKGVNKPILLPQTPLRRVASTLLFLFVAITTIRRGTMNWAQMIRHMLPSSMIVVGLKILKHLAAPPASMLLTMMIEYDNFLHLGSEPMEINVW